MQVVDEEEIAVEPQVGEYQPGDEQHAPEMNGAKQRALRSCVPKCEAEQKLEEQETKRERSKPETGEAGAWHAACTHGDPSMHEGEAQGQIPGPIVRPHAL